MKPRKWDANRVALLDGLMADGWTQQMIADHPSIQSTQAAISLFLTRRGESRPSRAALLPAGVLDLLRPAAKARKLSRLEVATSLLRILGADTALLDNVLDDGVTT